MDSRRVLIFREVARAGSISAAARELGWTQPAVSQHLRRLEREAGCPLLIRGAGGVTLTEAGAALLRRADAVASQLHMAVEEVAAHAELRGGRVRLVAFPSASAVLVPVALGALARKHPEIEVRLDAAEPPEAWAAVRDGDADLALVFGHDGPPDEDGQLQWRQLVREPLHLVLPAGHPSAARRSLRLDAFADDAWIAGCVRCRGHLEQVCRDAGFEPAIRHTTDDYVVVQRLVAEGLGVTLLPQFALDAYQHPGVVVRRSASFGRRFVGLAYRPGADDVPATRALIDELIAAARARTR